MGVTRRGKGPGADRMGGSCRCSSASSCSSWGLARTNAQAIGGPAFPGLIIILIGLVVGGPWLTERAARLFGRFMAGASSLLAARRLAD